MALASETYRLTQSFPREELYGLTSRVRRAVASVPSNIAEGHARNSTREYLNHLSIALGSLAETETQLLLAADLSYCRQDELSPILSKADEIGKMLRGLQKALRAKL